jgi:Beta-propeller repeat
VTPNVFSARPDNVFVTKLSPSGDVLLYSTFLGGSASNDFSAGIAVDAAGSAYITGSTNSTDFPITPSAAQPQFAGGNDGFVTKLDPSGSTLQFSTFLGGKDGKGGSRILVDSVGNSFVSGSTRSSDFPFTASFPTSPPPGSRIRPLSPDVFVAKLNATGTTRLYSVLVGGDRDDFEWDLDIDSSGNAFVGGATFSSNFPTTAGAFLGSLQDGSDSFAFKLNATGTALVYSTYLGDVGSSHRWTESTWTPTNGNRSTRFFLTLPQGSGKPTRGFHGRTGSCHSWLMPS